MTGGALELYKDVENNKLSKIMSVGDKSLYAASCPTFGDEYRAMMVIITKDKKDKEVRYRYDLKTGKQILIENEYSTILVKELRQIEAVLAMTYKGNGSGTVNNFYQSFLSTIDALNQNTEGWKSVLEDPDYANIPKFSNRRKPKKTSEE